MVKSKKQSADKSGTKTNHNQSGDSSTANHQNASKTEVKHDARSAPTKGHNPEDINDADSKNGDDSITRPKGMDA